MYCFLHFTEKKKYQIDCFYCNVIKSYICRPPSPFKKSFSEPSKTCFSRFSKMMSLYIDFQIYQGQTQNNNYTRRQKYEQTMNKECLFVLAILTKEFLNVLSPENITNKIKFNVQNKHESYPMCVLY